MDRLPKSWENLLSGDGKQLLARISDRVTHARSSGAVAPALGRVFAAFELIRPESVRAVIIGQDPYHTPGLAQGLAFSIPPDVRPGSRLFPSSLRNINKALQIEGFGGLKSGDLHHWAEQGVLLLNATLTVEEGAANSHASFGWQEFTDGLISALSKHHPGIVWMLWGSFAQKKLALIDESGDHKILMASHPSGLSVYKTDAPFLLPGDTGSCGHFTSTNEWLMARGEIPVTWCA